MAWEKEVEEKKAMKAVGRAVAIEFSVYCQVLHIACFPRSMNELFPNRLFFKITSVCLTFGSEES